MTQDRNWADGVHQRAAEAIRTARKVKGMSAQELADETERLGYPISRSQIANYESGRKHSLDIAELLVIAAALDTAPVALLFPGPYQNQVRYFPKSRELPEIWAAQWFSGLVYGISDVPFSDGQAVTVKNFVAYDANLHPLRRARHRLELEKRRNALRRNLTEQRDPQLRSQMIDEIADLQRRIDEIGHEIGRLVAETSGGTE